MPSGQVSVWVPIVVGLLGIIGIVAGQLINSWREDRRWRRELQREDLRWERDRIQDRERIESERARDELRQAHEARIEWRLHRLELYQRFMSAVDRVASDNLVRFDFDKGKETFIVGHERIVSGFVDEIRQELVAVELIAGGSVLRLAQGLYSCASEIDRCLTAPISALRRGDLDLAKMGNPNGDKISYLKELLKVRALFVKEVKRELALEVSDASNGHAIPIPPSGSTS